MKLSVVTEGPDAGRVAGTVANRGTFILAGTGEQWQSPRSPSSYEETMQGDTMTAEGRMIKTANLSADVNHVGAGASFQQARDVMANTGTQLARVRFIDTPYGTVALGAAWPGLTDLQVRKMQASALSGDWRWREEYGGYDMAGAIFVNAPGFPLPDRPVFQPYALVASLGDPHPAVIGSWVCDEQGVCSMSDREPVLTLTLTASETARLHDFLTRPQVAAAPCSCQAHTAAGLPMGPGDQAPVDVAGAVTREEFDALASAVGEVASRVQDLWDAYMGDQMAAIDAMEAALPIVQTAAAGYSQQERDDLARRGLAMADGSFPIGRCSDVRPAINSMGRGDAATPEIKAHIISAAKQLDCVSELPPDWIESSSQTESISG
jgi:hypothetical protein